MKTSCIEARGELNAIRGILECGVPGDGRGDGFATTVTSNPAQRFGNEGVMFKGRIVTCPTVSLIAFLSVALPVGGAQAASCTIAVAQGTPASRLAQLAKVSRVDAERAALAHIEADRSTKVASSELEAEDGCLIWTFDLRVAGQTGVTEVHVDAGDGKVLGVEHEK